MARSSSERVAHNFIKRFGTDALDWLLEALARGDSGQEIADHFQVSRERVRQWKNAFGHVVTLYQVHPEVVALLNAPDPVPARRRAKAPAASGGVFLVAD